MTGVIMTLWAIINHGTKVSHAMTMVHHIRVPLWQLPFNFRFFIVSFAFLLYSFSMYVPKIVLVELFVSSCHLSLSLCTLSPTHVFFVSLPCSLSLFVFVFLCSISPMYFSPSWICLLLPTPLFTLKLCFCTWVVFKMACGIAKCAKSTLWIKLFSS